MSLIPDHVKDQIRQSVLLPEVMVEDGVRIKRQGRDWRGVCPFESGTTNPTKFRVRAQTYLCFSCGAKGDIFEWLMKRPQNRLGFREAARAAADRAGVDIQEYLRAKQQRPRDPAREAVQELLGMLSDFSRDCAEGMPAEQRTYQGFSLDALVESGEAGYIPDSNRLSRRLKALGIDERASRDSNLSDYLSESWGGGWVLWARKRTRIYAMRPLGADGPIAGLHGASSGGWVHAPRAPMTGHLDGGVRVALDDATYVALRSAGIVPVFRAASANAYSRLWSYIPGSKSSSDPPLLLLPSTAEARRAAYDAALRLAPDSPRLRVAEVDPLPVGLSEPERWRERLDRVAERAGTAFDWQSALIAAHGLLETPEGRATAAARLARLAAAVTAPVERAAYAYEVRSLTGVTVEEALSPTSMRAAPQRVRSRVSA